MRSFIGWVCIVIFILLILPGIAMAACPDDDVKCLVEVLNGKDSKAALKAAMRLGNTGNADAVQPLIKKLTTNDKYMLSACAYSLAKIGEPAVPALIEATKSKSGNTRKAAAHALGQIGGDAVYKALSKLSRDENADVRYRAFKAFQTTKDKRAVTDAIIALKDRHTKVKLEAIRLLGIVKNPQCIEALVTYGMIDLSPEVSLEAASVLIMFGTPSVDPLIRRFEKMAPHVQVRYMFVLGEIAREGEGEQAKKAYKFVLDVVAGPKLDPKVKLAAVSKLADVGDPAAIPVLQELKKKIEGKPEYEELLQMTVRSLEKLQKK